MKHVRLAIIGLTLGLAACATEPEKIATASVSPLQYQGYSCKQIGMELNRVSTRANQLHGSLKKTADNDQAQMAAGMIIFWPALFFLEGGDGPEAQEYAQLKGQYDALQQAAIEKNCTVTAPPLVTAKPEEKKHEPETNN